MEGDRKARYEEYLKQTDALEKKEKHIIMTHAQLLQMSEAQLEGYKIIIDEDILYTMLRNTKSVRKDDIEECLYNGMVNGEEAAELRRVLELGEDVYMKSESNGTDNTYIEKETSDENGICGNINELLKAGAYHCTDGIIEFFVPTKLPKKGLIIMSATLNENIYKLFFKDRKVIVYDTPKAKYTGKVIQYTHYSMSRANIEVIGNKIGSKEKLIEVLSGIAEGEQYRISFKSYDDLFKNRLHFGNSSGIDCLKGKNGMIVGTSHLNESSYKLIACYLGIETNGKEEMLRRRKIQYKGYEFSFMTYENETLREIQLYMIGSELEQCIGRSRLLREDALVYVFSNFPCEQAELHQEDYLKKYFENEKQTNVSDTDASAYEVSICCI